MKNDEIPDLWMITSLPKTPLATIWPDGPKFSQFDWPLPDVPPDDLWMITSLPKTPLATIWPDGPIKINTCMVSGTGHRAPGPPKQLKPRRPQISKII